MMSRPSLRSFSASWPACAIGERATFRKAEDSRESANVLDEDMA